MRKLLAFAAILGCVFAPALTLSARTPKKKPDPEAERFRQKLVKDRQALHALDRLTFGPKPGDLEAVEKMGLKKWIDLQLHPNKIRENPELIAKLEPLEALRLTQGEMLTKYPQVRRQPAPQSTRTIQDVLSPEELRMLRNGSAAQKKDWLASLPQDKFDEMLKSIPNGMRNQLLPAASPEIRRKLIVAGPPQQIITNDLLEGKLYRAILSNRQLEEQLVDFWFNHFNVYLDKGADRFMVPSYERDAIRPHVLGKFRDLLEATASSPAMLFYLDNWQSVAPAQPARAARARQRQTRGLNENYARELMELHTLGVDGGYTQKDVTEVARCFTGWTIKQPQQGGTFEYNDRVHDKGEKVVLGVKIPAGGGKEDGEKVLDILAKHPATARFISRKLAQRFVADNPPEELIERMAKTFRKKNGDLREVMKTMLTSDEFFSEGAYRAKVKTPLEMIVSAARATGAQVDYAMPLANQIAQLGQPLYRKQEPTGYPIVNSEWINSASLLGRMNFALALAQNRVPGVRVESAQFAGDASEIARQMMFQDLAAATLDAVTKALADQKDKNPGAPAPALLAGLVLGSPDFQRR